MQSATDKHRAVEHAASMERRALILSTARWLALAKMGLLSACSLLPAKEEAPVMDPTSPASSSQHDFDFLIGSWKVVHRRLRVRLAGNDEWDEFDGTCVALPLLGGAANVDDNVLHLPAGAYRAVSLRAYDQRLRRWAIWWLDGRTPHTLETPVVGGFSDGLGEFYASDMLDGVPVRVRFRWTDTRTSTPSWEQAFSADDGQSWEINWTMVFHRVANSG